MKQLGFQVASWERGEDDIAVVVGLPVESDHHPSKYILWNPTDETYHVVPEGATVYTAGKPIGKVWKGTLQEFLL